MKSPSEYANDIDMCGYDHDARGRYRKDLSCCAETRRAIEHAVFDAQVAIFGTSIAAIEKYGAGALEYLKRRLDEYLKAEWRE